MKKFEVWATYAKSVPFHSYIIKAENKKEAKKVFLYKYPWLDVIKEIKEIKE